MVLLNIPTLENVAESARKLVSMVASKRIVCFYGAMGAGKTTLIKAICQEIGVSEVVTSPSFSLVNEYTDGRGNPVFHFDFYRINRIEEVYDFGYEEYFYNPNGLCLVEWPEIVEELLPLDSVAKLHIAVNPDSSRTVTLSS